MEKKLMGMLTVGSLSHAPSSSPYSSSFAAAATTAARRTIASRAELREARRNPRTPPRSARRRTDAPGAGPAQPTPSESRAAAATSGRANEDARARSAERWGRATVPALSLRDPVGTTEVRGVPLSPNDANAGAKRTAAPPAASAIFGDRSASETTEARAASSSFSRVRKCPPAWRVGEDPAKI